MGGLIGGPSKEELQAMNKAIAALNPRLSGDVSRDPLFLLEVLSRRPTSNQRG